MHATICLIPDETNTKTVIPLIANHTFQLALPALLAPAVGAGGAGSAS